MIINPYIFGSTDDEGYGYLYNWYAASDSNFAPTDWKVPAKTDLDTLVNYLISNGYNYDDTTTGNKIGKSIANNIGWSSSVITGAVGNTDYSTKRNNTGFTAKPSGARALPDGSFINMDDYFYIWCNDQYSSSNGYVFYCQYADVVFTSFNISKNWGFSLRLLYTGTGSPTSVTDYDGNVYDVVLIGTQYWTVQNWKCTTLNNGTAIPNVTDGTTWAGLTTGARCAYDNDESNV